MGGGPRLKSCKILPLDKSYGKTAKTVRSNLLGTLKSIKRCSATQGGFVHQKRLNLSENTGLCGPSTPVPALPPQRWPCREQPTVITSEGTERSSFTRKCHCFFGQCLVAPWNPRSKGLFLVPLTGNPPTAKAPTQGCFGQNISRQTF